MTLKPKLQLAIKFVMAIPYIININSLAASDSRHGRTKIRQISRRSLNISAPSAASSL